MPTNDSLYSLAQVNKLLLLTNHFTSHIYKKLDLPVTDSISKTTVIYLANELLPELASDSVITKDTIKRLTKALISYYTENNPNALENNDYFLSNGTLATAAFSQTLTNHIWLRFIHYAFAKAHILESANQSFSNADELFIKRFLSARLLKILDQKDRTQITAEKIAICFKEFLALLTRKNLPAAQAIHNLFYYSKIILNNLRIPYKEQTELTYLLVDSLQHGLALEGVFYFPRHSEGTQNKRVQERLALCLIVTKLLNSNAFEATFNPKLYQDCLPTIDNYESYVLSHSRLPLFIVDPVVPLPPVTENNCIIINDEELPPPPEVKPETEEQLSENPSEAIENAKVETVPVKKMPPKLSPALKHSQVSKSCEQLVQPKLVRLSDKDAKKQSASSDSLFSNKTASFWAAIQKLQTPNEPEKSEKPSDTGEPNNKIVSKPN